MNKQQVIRKIVKQLNENEIFTKVTAGGKSVYACSPLSTITMHNVQTVLDRELMQYIALHPVEPVGYALGWVKINIL